MLLGLRNIARVGAAQAFAFVVHQQHDGHCLFLCKHKDFGQDFDDKFHGGVIVVQ
ncbi:Uncharacterised protein [Mycobacteroides abscessus subsp. massiliense]|nr:Uncharacterised protein [Mycobacteroides abscessus subsp. massiliense]